jgi:CRP/FNR family transcriptional regulator, cyclic AMP receptor protein
MRHIINILKQTEIFEGLSRSQLELIATICKEKDYNSREIVLLEGTPGDELFIIVDGKVDVQIQPGLVSGVPNQVETSERITSLCRGQSFGELALVDQGLRSATIMASETGAKLLTIHRDELIKMCEDYPQLGYRLMFNLAADLAFKMRGAGLREREYLLKRTE